MSLKTSCCSADDCCKSNLFELLRIIADYGCVICFKDKYIIIDAPHWVVNEYAQSKTREYKQQLETFFWAEFVPEKFEPYLVAAISKLPEFYKYRLKCDPIEWDDIGDSCPV